MDFCSVFLIFVAIFQKVMENQWYFGGKACLLLNWIANDFGKSFKQIQGRRRRTRMKKKNNCFFLQVLPKIAQLLIES